MFWTSIPQQWLKFLYFDLCIFFPVEEQKLLFIRWYLAMPLSASQQFLLAFYHVGDNGHLDVLDTNISLVGARVFVHIWNHRQ